jgi:hypothetical protein
VVAGRECPPVAQAAARCVMDEHHACMFTKLPHHTRTHRLV